MDALLKKTAKAYSDYESRRVAKLQKQIERLEASRAEWLRFDANHPPKRTRSNSYHHDTITQILQHRHLFEYPDVQDYSPDFFTENLGQKIQLKLVNSMLWNDEVHTHLLEGEYTVVGVTYGECTKIELQCTSTEDEKMEETREGKVVRCIWHRIPCLELFYTDKLYLAARVYRKEGRENRGYFNEQPGVIHIWVNIE